MKKLFSLVLVVAFAIAETGCSPLEVKARDTSAALNGAVTTAIGQYSDTCRANESQVPCQTIIRAAGVLDVLLTADETYCGWAAGQAKIDPNAVCVPNKSATGLLTVATENAVMATAEIVVIIKGGK